MFCYNTSYSSKLVLFVFFFFKQKTAYEMRISDWSSDVCSSDLVLRPAIHLAVIDGETPTQRIGDRASDRRIDIPFGGLRLVAHLDRPGKLAGRVSGTDVESAGDRVLAKVHALRAGPYLCRFDIEHATAASVYVTEINAVDETARRLFGPRL